MVSLPSHRLANHPPTLLSQLSIRIGISICQNGFLHTKSLYRSYTPFIITSVFGILGSVKSRNFVPVSVWKTVRRKKEDSRDSIPDARTFGSGNDVALGFAGVGLGRRGVKERVMAWTPWNVPARTR